jgi:hypothetical protein
MIPMNMVFSVVAGGCQRQENCQSYWPAEETKRLFSAKVAEFGEIKVGAAMKKWLGGVASASSASWRQNKSEDCPCKGASSLSFGESR